MYSTYLDILLGDECESEYAMVLGQWLCNQRGMSSIPHMAVFSQSIFLSSLIDYNILYYWENEGYFPGKAQLLRGMGSWLGIQRSLVRFQLSPACVFPMKWKKRPCNDDKEQPYKVHYIRNVALVM